MRDLAFSQRHDPNAEKCQSLEEAGCVFLVTAESIERLGNDNVEFAIEGTAHQRLETWS
ncbi:MAG TPA: hypothetical protein VNT81_00825 [Vicinamibacterales bacterium]|nr:hypothetical protein [Vicinamibacterales bacterium]